MVCVPGILNMDGVFSIVNVDELTEKIDDGFEFPLGKPDLLERLGDVEVEFSERSETRIRSELFAIPHDRVPKDDVTEETAREQPPDGPAGHDTYDSADEVYEVMITRV